MPFLSELLTLGLIGFLGALSPGPDFVIITQNSLQYGKKDGLLTVIGVSLGCLVHVTYCVIGIGMLLAQSVIAFAAIKYSGAAYLIYIGTQDLFKPRTPFILDTLPNKVSLKNNALLTPLKKGFLVNLLNPKATLFFLSVFTQVIDPQTPRWAQSLFGMELVAVAFCWFSTLVYILTQPALQKKLLYIQHHIQRVLGGFLILFGLKVATLN